MAQGLSQYLARDPNEEDPSVVPSLDALYMQQRQGPQPQGPQMDPTEMAIAAQKAQLGPNLPTPIPNKMSIPSRAIHEAKANKYEENVAQAMGRQEGGIDQLDQYIQDFAKKPTEVNWAPLAAMADQWNSQNGVQSHLLDASKTMTPFTADKKQEAIIKLQDLLQKRRETPAKQQIDMLKSQNDILKALANPTGAARMANYDERLNQDAGKVGQSFETDHHLKTMKNTQLNLARAQNIFDGDEPITAKTFNILQQDFINAMAPGGAATEGKVGRELIEPVSAMINNLELKYGKVTDLRKVPEAQPVLRNIQGLLHQIKQDYDGGMERQALDIAGSYTSNTNPRVQQTVREKMARYAPTYYKSTFGVESPYAEPVYGVQPGQKTESLQQKELRELEALRAKKRGQ